MNIRPDGLELLAGLPLQKVIEAHGSFSTALCSDCGVKADSEEVRGDSTNIILNF
jgi:NAD-dependent SIR2 family protein deacetylase